MLGDEAALGEGGGELSARCGEADVAGAGDGQAPEQR